jgi:hypothetical protein
MDATDQGGDRHSSLGFPTRFGLGYNNTSDGQPFGGIEKRCFPRIYDSHPLCIDPSH